MIINNLVLKNYRNYLEERFEFINGTNILIGDNGEGKTNVLEAIYMASIGRSFRTNREVEVVKFNEEFGAYQIRCTGEEALKEYQKFLNNIIFVFLF